MPAYTTDPPGQDGHSAGGGWSDAGMVLEASQGVFGGAIGLVFQAAGLPIESGEIRLVLDATTDVPALAVVQAWLVPQASPADYGGSHLPGARSELLIAETLTASAAPGSTITLVLGQTYNAANQPQIDAATAQLHAVTGLASWSHRLAVTVQAQTGDTLRFVASEGAGTAPTLDVIETAPQEVVSLAHVAKLIRETLIERLNDDSPALDALSLTFEDGSWPDIMGRAIDALGRNQRRGFIATHPETAPDPRQPSLRVLELHLVLVAGARDAKEVSDQLDDAQEAVEDAMERDPTLGGLAPAGAVFRSATPGIDGNGQRVFGVRWLTYQAQYARRRKA